MNTVERVLQECKDAKIPISRLERECGFSNGYIRNLREGNIPADRLLKIADHLGKSYIYLLTGEQPHEVTLSREESDILEGYRKADETTKNIIRKILDVKKDSEFMTGTA